MRKALALSACLAVLTTALFLQTRPSSAQLTPPDVVVLRKAAAATSKPRKSQAAPSPGVEQLKAEARARKGAPASAAAPPDATRTGGDVLSQSSKLRSRKEVAQADAGRSLEATRAFDALREKARADGSVRVIAGLRADFEPEGDLPTPAAVSEQRRGISSAQEAVLARVSPAARGVVKRFETVPYVVLEVDAAGVEALRSSPEVESVVEDVPVPATLAESVSLVGAPAAWSAGFTGAGQTVAVLDTGVDKSHPFLAGKVVSEACYSTTSAANDSNSVCPGGVSESTSSGSGVNCSTGGCEHGTHVAGIAAGKGATFNGVAPDANVIAVQIFSRFNDPDDCRGSAPCVLTYNSDQMKGLERVYALRSTYNVAAVNMSIGGGQYSSSCDGNPLKAVIDNLRAAGVATVIASGNEGYKDSISSPACISTAVSVGSTDDGSLGTAADSVSNFSNSASFLSLLAPGRWISSSVPGGSFSNFSGTSMATPHVAGAWAVLKSREPSATVTQALNALKDTGRLVTDVNGVTKARIRVDEAVNALGGGGDGGGGCGAPAPISFGQTVTGSLASADCRYPAGGGHYADAYTFTGAAGQQVAVSMSSAAFDTYVHLLGPGGAVVTSNDDSGGGTNSRIPPTSGFFTLPSSGDYTIQATSYSAGTSGSYTLALTAQTDNCGAATPISLGQTLSGGLSTSDCRLSDGSYLDKYSFAGTAGQQVSVSMSSSAFDTMLFLLSPDGSTLAYDDDGGGGTNSRIPASSGMITLPSTGTYLIYANSFSAGATGAYSVTLGGQAPGGACPSTSISVGQTVSGSLSSADCRLSDNSLFDSYTFSGASGQQISVSMSSAAFDTYLLLLRPDGSPLAEDDDGGDALNSRIPASSGTITLPASGTYRILANSFVAGATGAYTLTLSGAAPVTCSVTAVSVGQTVSGALGAPDCQSTDGSYFDIYAFTGAAGQQVAVSMSSLSFDTYLVLAGPNGLVVENDDDGGGLNSRVPPGSGFFTLPTTGAYFVYATSFNAGVTGGYTLSLITSQGDCAYSLSAPGASFGFGGGAGSVGVTAGAGCGWHAVSNAGWITVTSGANGSGGGSVGFSVAANNTPEARAGTLTVAGRPYTVEQAANPASSVQLSATAFGPAESAGRIVLSVTRTGNTSAPASVDYATSDLTASRLTDYTQTLGTLVFAPGETSKAVTVFLTNDVFAEPHETFSFTLSNASGAALGQPAAAVVSIGNDDVSDGVNPVGDSAFDADFFVRQHYVDFLNREADAPGLAFWTGELAQCAGDIPCRDVKRVNVSAAFFLSIEFQNTGYLVYRFYKAAYGDATSPNVPGTVPVIRLDEFLPDTQRIGRNVVVNQGDWPTLLEQNKQAYALEFAQRARFLAAFPASMTPAQFVDKLRANMGGALTQAERDLLVAELSANNTTAGRASVLRKAAEDVALQAAESNRAFVLMQYYGYLRRNPDDSPEPGLNFGGWKFWLDKLNQFGGDFVEAEMVKAFLASDEYRRRFGP